MRRSLVAVCFALSTQQINSFRASGVRDSHSVATLLLAESDLCMSDGSLCTVPLESVVVAIKT